MMEAASLKKLDEVLKERTEEVLQNCYSRYSKEFLFLIMSLVKGFSMGIKMMDSVIKE